MSALARVHVLLASVLSVVLVVTVISPVAAEELPFAPVEVPPLVSAELDPVVSSTPEGDFTALAETVDAKDVTAEGGEICWG